MTKMRLSETPSGRAWLENFDETDRVQAIDLLGSLRVVSADSFSENLRRTLLAAARESPVPVALLTIRDIERNATLGDVLTSRIGGAGSEDVVSGIVTNASRQLQTEGVEALPDPNLSEMRESRIRSVIFVDDYCGSGTTFERYLRSWNTHPTVRSWRSYGYLRFKYCVYSASRPGLSRIKRLRPQLEDVIQVEPGHDLWSREMSEKDRESILGLCRRYSGKQKPALGYGKAGGLFMAVHTVPNTVPAVLIQTAGRRLRPWTPLVKRNQGLTPEEQSLFGDRVPISTALDAVADLGRSRLALGLAQLDEGRRRLMLTVVSAMGTKRANVEEIARVCLLPTHDVMVALDLAIGAGLVDELKMRVTDEGRRELHMVRPRRTPATVADWDEPYYPHQLRG